MRVSIPNRPLCVSLFHTTYCVCLYSKPPLCVCVCVSLSHCVCLYSKPPTMCMSLFQVTRWIWNHTGTLIWLLCSSNSFSESSPNLSSPLTSMTPFLNSNVNTKLTRALKCETLGTILHCSVFLYIMRWQHVHTKSGPALVSELNVVMASSTDTLFTLHCFPRCFKGSFLPFTQFITLLPVNSFLWCF